MVPILSTRGLSLTHRIPSLGSLARKCKFMVRPDFNSFFESWGAELCASADQVRLLIGDAHWLSDGLHKEYLLRDLLLRYLPDRFWASSGFVRPPHHSSCCSPEIDVLIADSFEESPFLRTPNLLVVPPNSVIAHIQVKSNLTAKSLRLALANQIATQYVISQYTSTQKDCWRGIFFSSDSSMKGAATLHHLLAAELARPDRILACIPNAVFDRPSVLDACYLPYCITTFAGCICFLDRAKSKETIRTRFFDTSSSAACALASLFAFIRQNCGAHPVASATELAVAAGVGTPYRNCLLTIPHETQQ